MVCALIGICSRRKRERHDGAYDSAFNWIKLYTNFSISCSFPCRQDTHTDCCFYFSLLLLKLNCSLCLGWKGYIFRNVTDFSPDSSAHLDKWSKHHHVRSNSRFDLHSPQTLYSCFRKQHGHVFCLRYNCTWPVKGSVSKYAGADWLSSSVSQTVTRGQLHVVSCRPINRYSILTLECVSLSVFCTLFVYMFILFLILFFGCVLFSERWQSTLRENDRFLRVPSSFVLPSLLVYLLIILFFW